MKKDRGIWRHPSGNGCPSWLFDAGGHSRRWCRISRWSDSCTGWRFPPMPGGTSSKARPTKDIDLLGLEASDAEKVIEVFQAICLQPVEPDGLEFDPSTVACTPIRAAVKGLGLQVTLQGCLGSMRVAMQADIGYEDVIHPGPMQADYPALLDLPPPRLLGYTRETVVAEKLEAMVRLRMYNSRMKDFHDIGFLSANFSF